MPQSFKLVNPNGDVYVPALAFAVVHNGDVVEFPDEAAAGLEGNPIWEPVGDAPVVPQTPGDEPGA